MADPIEAFRFPVAIDLGRGELAKERDYSAWVAQLVRQVLLTAPGERVNLPTFGAGLKTFVFANIDEATASLVQTTVFQSLDRWLGNLITVNDVQATASNGTLNVSIVYTLKARGNQQILNLEVTQ